MSVQESIDRAVALHRAGQLVEAQRLYRQVLAAQGENADVLQFLGIVTSQLGNHEEAATLIRRAIALDPRAAIYHGNLGLALSHLDRFNEAEASFQRAVELGCKDINVLNNFGNVLRKQRKLDSALALFREIVSVAPDFADAHNNLGLVLFDLGRYDEAIVEYNTALRLRPDYCFAHNNLGSALLKRRRFEESKSAFRAALAIDPNYAEALMNLGVALMDSGQPEKAIELLNRSLNLRPAFFEALLNLGQSCCDTRRFDEAIEVFRRAVALRPDDADAHFHLSGVLLLTGRFQEGWREYEWRLKKPELRHDEAKFGKPRWRGEDLGGKRILVHSEQGAGDLIQFCRLAPMLSARGAEVILDCAAPLLPLVRTLRGVARVVSGPLAASEYDCYCYLLSLPLLLGITSENVPSEVPYLYVDRALRDGWRERLGAPGRKKVGINWAGNPAHSNDHNRSIPLNFFAPLAAVSDVVFVSLCKGDRSGEARPAGLEIIDHTSQLKDYAETAALIENLDLVISCDTSVAHVAGAIGKPVWTLLPFNPDLRWLLDRSDSPWYPTMRLFRQSAPGDWKSVVRLAVEALNAAR